MRPASLVPCRLASLSFRQLRPLSSARFVLPQTCNFSTVRPRCKNKSRSTTNLPREGGTDPREVFSELNVLSGLPTPASAVEAVYRDGFLLNNGVIIRGDGVFLLNNDAFRWRAVLPDARADGAKTELALASEKAKTRGLLELSTEVWGILDVVYPKPDLLILGTGHRTLLLHPDSRKRLQDLGINIDVMDTHNAAAQYNLLATERPGSQIAAALLIANFG